MVGASAASAPPPPPSAAGHHHAPAMRRTHGRAVKQPGANCEAVSRGNPSAFAERLRMAQEQLSAQKPRNAPNNHARC